MTRTGKLLMIVILLCVLIVSYVLIADFENIMAKVTNFVMNIAEPEIIVPETNKYKKDFVFETVKETNNFDPKNINDVMDIYYTALNNGWDEFTFYCHEDYPTCADDVKLIAEDSDFIVLINNYVNPYNSYTKYNTFISGDREIHLTVEKLYTNEEIKKINAEIDRIFSELKINTENPTKDDIKELHNYLIKNTTYDDNYDPNNRTESSKAGGALFNKIALCSGYTDALAIMLDKLNVPNFKISTEEHVWNVVYFEDKWTHIDATWDDDEVNENNYYNFFMIDTDTLLGLDIEEHLYDSSLYLELK